MIYLIPSVLIDTFSILVKLLLLSGFSLLSANDLTTYFTKKIVATRRRFPHVPTPKSADPPVLTPSVLLFCNSEGVIFPPTYSWPFLLALGLASILKCFLQIWVLHIGLPTFASSIFSSSLDHALPQTNMTSAFPTIITVSDHPFWQQPQLKSCVCICLHFLSCCFSSSTLTLG